MLRLGSSGGHTRMPGEELSTMLPTTLDSGQPFESWDMFCHHYWTPEQETNILAWFQKLSSEKALEFEDGQDYLWSPGPKMYLHTLNHFKVGHQTKFLPFSFNKH